MVSRDDAKLVRLSRFLAMAGVCSRRKAEELIRDGHVEVDGAPVPPTGILVDPGRQKVTVDGEPVGLRRTVHLAFHKPSGVVCTNGEEDRGRRVIDRIGGFDERLYTVGRLDADSTGLILVTNDGGFAEKVAHPRHGIEKTYEVRVKGRIPDLALRQLRAPLRIGDLKTAGARVTVRDRIPRATDLVITLTEGRNREIRRMCAKVGHPVLVLHRVRVGAVKLGELPRGAHRPLSKVEVEALSAGRNDLQRRQGDRS